MYSLILPRKKVVCRTVLVILYGCDLAEYG
jgi:hypothetical protein